ncbi:uncharacterized protein LOC131306830 [Rhododendron vialii]|uniref:uncharacterized protein LOC131306830 n=1 Tax=Rhododendron vialii TaxID=182163 RepID=UPI00265D8C45|nr:uncharacterized protein LOC131306830 [Rhododendron vialii]
MEDSVKVEPRLATAVLQGLALPKDMDKIPEGLQPSLVHASAYLVQAGQALLRSSINAELVLAERTRFHEDLKVEHEKVRSYKGSLKMAKAQIAELEKERDEMEERMKKAEHEVAKVLRREKWKMKEVDSAAYHAGFDRAGAEYMQEARSMVNDAIKMRVPIAYRTGYKDGVKAACGVMQLEADMNLTKSIPAPVTPELVLPYTEEECAPLPPEEFPESEDDVEDLTDADVAAEDLTGLEKDGDGGKKAVVHAEQEPVNVDKDA